MRPCSLHLCYQHLRSLPLPRSPSEHICLAPSSCAAPQSSTRSAAVSSVATQATLDAMEHLSRPLPCPPLLPPLPEAAINATATATLTPTCPAPSLTADADRVSLLPAPWPDRSTRQDGVQRYRPLRVNLIDRPEGHGSRRKSHGMTKARVPLFASRVLVCSGFLLFFSLVRLLCSLFGRCVCVCPCC